MGRIRKDILLSNVLWDNTGGKGHAVIRTPRIPRALDILSGVSLLVAFGVALCGGRWGRVPMGAAIPTPPEVWLMIGAIILLFVVVLSVWAYGLSYKAAFRQQTHGRKD